VDIRYSFVIRASGFVISRNIAASLHSAPAWDTLVAR
jgi:hypothetical protein